MVCSSFKVKIRLLQSTVLSGAQCYEPRLYSVKCLCNVNKCVLSLLGVSLHYTNPVGFRLNV